MGNTTVTDKKTEIYVTLDETHAHFLTNPDDLDIYITDLLQRLVLSNSFRYNCIVEKTQTNGFNVIGLPKNEAVLHPQILHRIFIA